jgi:hypothetical protein
LIPSIWSALQQVKGRDWIPVENAMHNLMRCKIRESEGLIPGTYAIQDWETHSGYHWRNLRKSVSSDTGPQLSLFAYHTFMRFPFSIDSPWKCRFEKPIIFGKRSFEKKGSLFLFAKAERYSLVSRLGAIDYWRS